MLIFYAIEIKILNLFEGYFIIGIASLRNSYSGLVIELFLKIPTPHVVCAG